MEVIIIALIILCAFLYSSKKDLQKSSIFYENKFKEYYDKYNEIIYQKQELSVDNEITKPKKLKSGLSNGITQEQIISFQEKKLEKKYLYPKKDLEDKSNHFYGKKVVITGDFENYPDRNQIAKMLWEVGADVDTGVGKNTQILIYGNNPGPSKMMLAEDIECELINEDDFIQLFNS